MNKQEHSGCVYCLIDPEDKTVRYVGATRFIINRARRHCKYDIDAKHTDAYRRWKGNLRKRGLEPLVAILEDDVPLEHLFVREALWITHGFNKRWPLVNVARSHDILVRQGYDKDARMTRLR